MQGLPSQITCVEVGAPLLQKADQLKQFGIGCFLEHFPTGSLSLYSNFEWIDPVMLKEIRNDQLQVAFYGMLSLAPLKLLEAPIFDGFNI